MFGTVVQEATSFVTPDSGCISINPLFVNAVAGDYHLLPNSPCRVLGEDGTQMGRYGPDPGEVTGVGRPTGSYPIARLLQNAPNPFNRSTLITVMSRKPLVADLEVYTITGRLVLEKRGLALGQGSE